MQLYIRSYCLCFSAELVAFLMRPKTVLQNYINAKNKCAFGNLPLNRLNMRPQTIHFRSVVWVEKDLRDPFIGA